MSAETTTTTLATGIDSEWIDRAIMDFLTDAVVAVPLCYHLDLSDKSTIVGSMPRWVKDTAQTSIAESAGMSNTALDLAEGSATVTCGVFGIMYEVKDLAASATVLGESALPFHIAKIGAILLADMMEDDVCGTFGSIATTVGLATTDLAISTMVGAQMGRRTNNARGEGAFVLDDQQLNDLTAAVVGSSASVFTGTANQSVLNGRSDGYAGDFLGNKVFYSNLCDTENTAASVIGALLSVNDTIAFATKWLPRMKSLPSIAGISTLYGISGAWGVSERRDLSGIKIKTDA